MALTLQRQETDIRQSDLYDDTLVSGVALESSAANLESDLNSIRSQLKRILNDSAGNWYDDIPTVNSKQRDLTDLSTDLDNIEETKILCGVEVLQNVIIPANAYASGTITAVAQSNITDAETFTVSDNINPTVTFEFDTNGSVSETATLRQVDITSDTTAITVASRMVTAINNAPSLNWTADNASGTSATVTLTHNLGGTHANGTLFTEAVADAGFTLVQPTGGAGDVVVLSQASSETPSVTAAADAGTALGALVAVLSGDVGANDLAEISSTNPTTPKNRLLIRDAQLREGLTAQAAPYTGRQIYGLLQAESGTIDGDTFNDTDKQVQISFVMIVDDDLVPAPGEDVGGSTIEYIYAQRTNLANLPEDCAFPHFTFTDGSASVSVTLDNAVDNQGVTPVTQNTDIFWDLGAGREIHFRDNAGVDFFGLHEDSAGSATTVHVHSAVDFYENDAADVDFGNGIQVNSLGTQIDIGTTAGRISSAGLLELFSGAGQDVHFQSANEITFNDTNKGGSTYASNLKLSDTSAEWDAFETAFGGEVSLLNAIVAAYDAVGNVQKSYATVQNGPHNADVNITGAGGTPPLDATLHDISNGDFLVDHDVFLNGNLMRPGADATANNDYYPGDSLANGDLKFERKLKDGDVIGVISRQ